MKTLISILFLSVIQLQLFARIIMTPYLQAVTETSVYVLVECDKADTVAVDYGLTPGLGFTALTESIAMTTSLYPTYVHKIKLTGLSPSSKYYYHASQGSSVSKNASFFTAVPQGIPFRLVWMADCRTNTAVFARISRNMQAVKPAVALYGGDLCHDPTYIAWKNEFFITGQLAFASQVPFFSTPGNHEGWTQNTKAFEQNPASASGTQDYYSLDYGDLHVLCLNTELPYDSGTQQYEFVKNDLEHSMKPWKFVIAHTPAYCNGGHGEDAAMIKITKSIFEPAKVDMVLAGHTHFYQHNLVNGIHHMVIGSAGAPLYTPEKAWYTVTQSKDYNFAVIDVSPSKISVAVYNEEMVKLDSLELVK